MKKVYSAPALNVVKINNAVLNNEISSGGKGTPGADTNNIELELWEDEFDNDNLF